MDKLKQNKNLLIIIGAIILLAVVFLITKNTKDTPEEIPDDIDVEDVLNSNDSNGGIEVPMPEEASWVPNEVSVGRLTLDIPLGYFVSKPNILGCDVTSISTMQNGKPLSVAFVYNIGCSHPDLAVNYSKRVEKNGYIFRTNYSSPSVLAIFDKIVESAR